ncbi:MAG: NYN domain-containing protein [Victivallales bacterium]|nr:NYN domain-containing protein [Victivallales bacterium]
MSETTAQLALLMDFDGFLNGFGTSEDDWKLSINDIIMQLEKRYGAVVYRKAIADWSSPRLRRAAQDLQRYNVEMIHVFKGGHSSRYISDNQLIQATQDCMLHFPALDTYVLSFGEGDYMSAVCRLKANGKKIVGLVADGVSLPGALVRNLDDVFYINDKTGIFKEKAERNSRRENYQPERPAIVETIRNIIGVNGLPIEEVFAQLKEKDPNFSLETYGVESFEDLIRAYPNFLKFSETDSGVLVVPSGGVKNTCPFTPEELKKFNLTDYMQATRWYIHNGTIRDRVLHNIYTLLEEPGRSMTNEELRNLVDPEGIVEDRPWYGTIFSLAFGACLWESPETSDLPLQKHILSLFKTVHSEEDFLVRYYISLFHKAFSERPELTPRVCAELMHPDDVESHIPLFEQVLGTLSQRRSNP